MNSYFDPVDYKSMNRLLTINYRQQMNSLIKDYIRENGSKVKGDHLLDDNNIQKITLLGVEHIRGEKKWEKELNNILNKSDSSIYNELNTIITKERNNGFNMKDKITEIIVDHRLSVFSKMLSSFGFDMHLITLPEFHVTAYNMHKLSSNFPDIGINAFVKDTQRPERKYSLIDTTYTYYKHQSATGTGVEAEFNKAVGSSDINTLSDSTESDDLKKRN